MPLGSDHELQKNHVEPLPELIADLFEMRNAREAEALLQCEAGRLIGAAAANERVKARGPRAGD